ncbi:dehypoxanthine futalosine cyclase [Candidatus Sumerlaeota bacterium]|nr:dehypoxanthine futalosine cyclase [Candidatus Sumerlaeota bacterium]
MKPLSSILQKSFNGERITDEECLALFRSNDLLALGQAANAARWRKIPEKVATYIVDRNVNYTNVCVVDCQFCAFYAKPKDAEKGYVLDRETMRQKFAETAAHGGTQVLMQGGHHPTLKLEWYEELLRWAKSEFPMLQMHCFSPPEIIHFTKMNRLSVRETLQRLMAAGLESLPGGGAEILSERVRKQIAPRKATSDEWIGVMREAHKLGMKTSATMMFGHVEQYEDRVEHLRRIRGLQDETGGFIAFIPWTFQAENTPGMQDVPMVGGHEYLKTLAISRLYLDNFRNIQASWVTQGKQMCQIGLMFGGNDVGSTMLEENVVSAAGCSHDVHESDLLDMIRDIGLEPRQRNFYYEILDPPPMKNPEFFRSQAQ